MVFKGLIAAAAAVALSATPAVAAANGAAAAAQAAAVAPATETVDEDSELFGRGGFIIPLIAIVAIILGILAATKGGGNGAPESP